MLMAACDRALAAAEFLEKHPPVEELGLNMVLTELPPEGDLFLANLFTPDPEFLLPSQVDAVVAKGLELLNGEAVIESLLCVAPLGQGTLNDALQCLGQKDADAKFILMNARDYADLRMFGRDILNFETRTEMLKLGVMGDFWRTHVIVRRGFPVGRVLVVSGSIPIEYLEAKDVCVINVTR